MIYLGVTQPTASWLLGKASLIDALFRTLVAPDALSLFAEREFVEGPVRISSDSTTPLIAIWNGEYATGTGDESWGFIALDGELGLTRRDDIAREVFERSLYVISQRLQGLLIDGAYIHRAWENGAHTCLAGRGQEARQVSIAYFERNVSVSSTSIHAVVIVGPEWNLEFLSHEAVQAALLAGDLVQTARRLYDPARRKPSQPSTDLSELRKSISAYTQPLPPSSEFANVDVAVGKERVSDKSNYATSGWDYAEWIKPTSPLSVAQRRLLTSDAIERHPIRIVGPAGSGKTLLMQLLAVRRLDQAQNRSIPARVLYLVHNSKMVDTVRHRFSTLMSGDISLISQDRQLQVLTLSDYGREALGLTETQLIDPDAYEAKEFQLTVLSSALNDAMALLPNEVSKSTLFQAVRTNNQLHSILVRLLMAEISSAIKGHGLGNDERRYVESERAFSRLHGVLDANGRRIVFAAFKRYQEQMLDGFGVLDTDDIALSLLGKLRTPIWELKRRELGYDHVFIDEAQLFNENERRLFPFLAKTTSPYVPVVVALDEAQDLYGQVSAGMAALGIANVANENLTSIHRSSPPIVRLAFFVIQRCTDLFGPDFPDFTQIGDEDMESTEKAVKPRVEVCPPDQERFGKFILNRIRNLRKTNVRRVAVICMTEQIWSNLVRDLTVKDLPLHVLESRGERLSLTEPIVVISRPQHIGGQEFDAVIIAGAEQGLFPPRVVDNDALAATVEQQALREMYLAITRARSQIIVALSRGASLSPVLEDAAKSGLLQVHEAT